MQIGNSSPLNPRRRAIDLTRDNREGLKEAADRAVDNIQQAREFERAEAARQAESLQRETRTDETRRREDSIELSREAERLAADELPGPRGARETPEARAERVAELKEAFERGDLHSPERLERAAERLLMNDDE